MFKALSDACKLAKTQRVPGKQLVFLTDGIFRSTGYALTIRRLNQYEKRMQLCHLDAKSSRLGTSKYQSTQTIFSNLKGFSRVYTLYVGDHKTNNFRDR